MIKKIEKVTKLHIIAILVGGLYETIGSPQNLHSFGEYFPSAEEWVNLENSGILSTGTAQSIAIIESDNDVYQGIVVGGVFNYLNHTSNTISFGNIAFYNESGQIWQTLGWGCDGPVTSLAVIRITNSLNCTIGDPCYTIVAGGHFDVCFQVRKKFQFARAKRNKRSIFIKSNKTYFKSNLLKGNKKNKQVLSNHKNCKFLKRIFLFLYKLVLLIL